MFTTIVFQKHGPVAEIALNRPEVLNAYNTAMRDDLWEILGAVRDDDEVRVVLLRGMGRAFCAGADLTEFGTAPSQAVARQVRWARDVWGALRTLPKPVVAALHGFALGAGLEMALLCDLRIAERGTRFGLPEMRWGMIPAAGGTQSLPRVVNVGPALDLALTGRILDAETAHQRGIIHRVVEDGTVYEAGLAPARTLAERDPLALALAKRAINDGLDLPLADGLRLENRLAREAWLARAG